MKKYAPYRVDKPRYGKAQQEKLRELKGKVAERTGGEVGGPGADAKGKKRKGKKERMRMRLVEEEEVVGSGGIEVVNAKKRKLDEGEDGVREKKRKRRHRKEGGATKV